MDALISRIASQNNTKLISAYMADISRLETGKIDQLLKLGGCNTDLFLRVALENLTGQKVLNKNVKHLLQNLNLPSCCEQNQVLYLELCDTIANLSDISVTDMRFVQKLITDTWRSVRSRLERKIQTVVVADEKKGNDLVNNCQTLSDITKAITEERITSVFTVVEMLLPNVLNRSTPNGEDTVMFITTIENLCSDKKLQKVSAQFLDINIAALRYSSLSQSDQ